MFLSVAVRKILVKDKVIRTKLRLEKYSEGSGERLVCFVKSI